MSIIEKELIAMTRRAEKAEAEVARLREALAVCARAGCPEAGRAVSAPTKGEP